MAFWGIEVKPGKPYVHRPDDERGILHVSQATLGTGSSDERSIVLCEVGNKKPSYLCSLLPGKLETSALNLKFEEKHEITFSIIGKHSVHLTGLFYGDNDDQASLGDGYGSDPYGGDVMETDSEENSQIVVKGGSGVPVFESEDEDGFPVSTREKKSDISKPVAELEETTDEKIGEETQKKNGKDDAACGKKLKRKIDAAEQDDKPAWETVENDVKPKKNKKKKISEKSESAQDNVMPNSDGKEESPVAEIGNDQKPSSEKKKDKKKKKKNKKEVDASSPNTEEKPTGEKASLTEKQEKEEAKSLPVRSFPNGLVIEELAMGKPDGKRASPGKKVGVRYIGKLKKNGKIFDSNIGKSPFKFRLGIGQVIKGWDVGVNGMRVGDKRRLTIPPAMGYGTKGCGPAIPPNSWLVFDVELVDAN